MVIDKKYVKDILSMYADASIELTNIKQEILDDRDFDNDDKWTVRDRHIIKTFLEFGTIHLLNLAVERGDIVGK